MASRHRSWRRRPTGSAAGLSISSVHIDEVRGRKESQRFEPLALTANIERHLPRCGDVSCMQKRPTRKHTGIQYEHGETPCGQEPRRDVADRPNVAGNGGSATIDELNHAHLSIRFATLDERDDVIGDRAALVRAECKPECAAGWTISRVHDRHAAGPATAHAAGPAKAHRAGVR